MRKLKGSRFLAVIMSCLLAISTVMSTPVLVAAADMDPSNNSTVNPPQSIAGKTEIATWSYSNVNAAPDFPATGGYYKITPAGTNSTLQLFKNNQKATTVGSNGFQMSTGTISNSGYNGLSNICYWLISTSTKGFKDLVFNFSTRSSGTGPRDFNTEWSTDGKNWNKFGNTYSDTSKNIKIESTSPVEKFGMTLPAEAANQDTLYIRIIKESDTSEKGGTNTVQPGGTHGVNDLQLYGTKDPNFTTQTVTMDPDANNPILEVAPISLFCADSEAQIYYTTDGTDPATAAGGSTKLYTAPFTPLSEGGFKGTDPFVVKAIAVKSGFLPCDVVTASFSQQPVMSNADAKKVASGAYIWVKGIGTYLNGKTTLYIQDGMNAGSGLCIYNKNGDFTSYLGKEIYVHGKASPYNGLMEIVPDTIDATNVVVRNASPTLPTPTTIMFDQLSDRTYEGMLVSCDTVKLDNITTSGTSYYNHKVSQAGIQYTLRAKAIDSSIGTNGSYINITKAVANYNNGVQLLCTNNADLVAAATPTVEFITSSEPRAAAIPLNTKVTLTTATSNAKITYSLNGGLKVTSTGNSADITIDKFLDGKAVIKATASDGSYTTAEQTFTYTQSKVADVLANPGSSAITAATPITLSTSTENAKIVYSLYKNSYSDTDGTLVGTPDQIYTTPIKLDASYFPVRITAKATLDNYLDSDVASFAYTSKKAAGGEKNYYGSIHAHTAENSDGQGTLAEADAYARDEGKFDFFILTDHSNSFDKAPASDSLATIGNLNSYNTTNQQWLNGKQAAAAATRMNDQGQYTFLCDYGYEMTWAGGPGHMNTFNTAGFVSRNNTELNDKTNPTKDKCMQNYYKLLENTPGSISQFNHPGTTFGNFTDFAYYDPAIDDKVDLIEVGNGEGAVDSTGYFQSIDQYIEALDKGWHLAPTNNGDNHKKGWGTSNTCATVVYTNDFTMSGIYQAMRDRSVWATENRDLDVTYHLSDGTNTYSMGAILDAPPAAANITITAKNKNPGKETSNIYSIQLISCGGKVVDEKDYDAGSSDVTYTYSMTAPAPGYYFAEILDNQHHYAVTAPIWLGSAIKVGITSVVNSTAMPVTTEALNLTTTFFNNEKTDAVLKSVSYTVDGDAAANKAYDLNTSIPADGDATHVFSYTPTTAGTKTVNIRAVINFNGKDLTYTETSTMKVADINKVLYVSLDASHGNEYVSGGGYPASMANMMTLAGSDGVRVVQLNTSQDLINACSNPKYKMIILNAPSRKSVTAWLNPTDYTTDEIAALKAFSENGNTLVFGDIADYAESTNADAASPKKHMAELQNDVLSAIGSTLREGDDEVMDDDNHSGSQTFRLLPTEFNKANPLLEGVVTGQTYSQYSGSSIYAVDPATGERTSILPKTVSPLVYAFPTTYSAECDNDNFGYGSTKAPFPFVTVGSYETDKGMNNADGIYIPKYVNTDSSIATNPEEKLLAASETVVHPNGKTSLVVVAGGSFMSNFEIQVTMENASTLPYANYNIMDNLYKIVNPVTITSIADAKNLPDGTDVVIEGTATTGVNTQSTDADTNKGFFDCIYAQDATGGINLFPVASGIKEGQKARFYGKIAHYQGEVELTVSNFTILDESINKITPADLTTKDSMLPSNTGLLVKTQGIVSNIYKDTDGTINQFTIDDGTGPAIVYINGYITKGTALPFIKDGATVSVTGLASIGEVSSDSDMHPRIRVRDRGEIVNIDVTPPVITVTGVENGKVYNTDVTPVFSANEGTVTATLNGKEYKGGEITAEGKYELIVTAEDLAGNKSQIKIDFTIDKTAPVITITGIENDKAYDGSVKPIISVDDKDAAVAATLDGNAYNNSEIATVGNHTLVVTATDKAGNSSSKTVKFTINNIVVNPNESQSVNTSIDAVNNSKETDVTVNVSGSPVLSEAFVEGVKDSDKVLTVNMTTTDTNGNNIYITFTAPADKLKPLDMTVYTNSVNSAAIEKEDSNAMIISFKDNGILPAPATLRIKLSSSVDASKPVYFYYYNPVTKAMELVAGPLTPDKDGYVTVTIKHCSDYAFSNNSKLASGNTSNTGTIIKTGSVANTANLVVTGIVLALAGLALILFRRKRNSGTNNQ